ncbi:MAG: Flp pilus assembly complex ATPase component TadA [Planctomycetaceae bacterium]|nr:Flp pilus assembly complex ATPase component TadA [Planctomycetaceae bacterium]
MPAPVADLPTRLRGLDAAGYDYATQFVELLLAEARERATSDVHLQPTPQGLAIRWRIDGVLQPLGEFPSGQAADVVTRLKVLAGLLTYKTDVPQEGRIPATGDCEMRVSTFPTLHGERAVVRLFAAERQFITVADLGLPGEIEAPLMSLLDETSGAILITGPAGSGKTTTAYACLRHITARSHGQRSIVSLEDPIEMALDGVAQSQVNPAAGFDLPTGLRSLMRQDPEVILVGEVRDAQTAATAFQASLTGHLVLSTFHAGSAASGLARVIDLGIEPYLVRSGLRAMLHQRLVRRLCECAQAATPGSAGPTAGLPSSADPFLGLPIKTARIAAGCPKCSQTSYLGRLVLAELLPPLEGDLGRAVLARSDVHELHRLAMAAGMTEIYERACQAAEAGQTDPAEIRRVLGLNAGSGTPAE